MTVQLHELDCGCLPFGRKPSPVDEKGKDMASEESTRDDESSAGCGLPFLRKSKPAGAKGKEIAVEDEIDLFEEDYDAMLRGNSASIPGDDEFEEIPGAEVMEELYKVQVVNKNREKVVFRDLIQSKEYKRHVVVFIRHFFCGNCYGYVKALSTEMPLSKFTKLKPSTKLTIIGCGDPILIPQYIQQTGCPYEIYADPSRTLYKRLGMAAVTTPPPEMPQYVKKYSLSFMANLMRSFALTGKTGKISGGPIMQVGGELIWIDGELQHMHRMKNAGDHMEVSDLIKLMRRQEREINRRDGSVKTGRDPSANESKRSSFHRALSRISSLISLGDASPVPSERT